MRASLVVIPTYNEAESIAEILSALKPLDCDVLVIDDGSPDGTAHIVRNLGIEVIERKGKQGLGSAYRAGFSIAIDRGYTYVIQMDADGSHQIKDLKKMMEWIGSADLLIGSRYVKDGAVTNWSKFRENLSKTANLYSTIFVNDQQSRLSTPNNCSRSLYSNILHKQIDRRHALPMQRDTHHASTL